MVIKTTAENFLTALKDGIKVSKKQSIPILGCVRVRSTEAGAEVIATDLDMSTSVPFEGNGEPGADFLVPYHQAAGVLQGEKGKLTITYERGELREQPEPTEGEEPKEPQYNPGTVTFAINGCEFKFESLNVLNFPETPVVSGTPVYIEEGPFNELVQKSRFAISQEDSRYTLKGALLEVKHGIARMVGTDGHRLSLIETREAYVSGLELRVVVPSDALDWLYSHTDEGSLVCIMADDTNVSFTQGGKILTARKMTGQFPNWEAVMPREFKTTMHISSADILGKTLARVAKCADARSGAVRWKLAPEGAEIHAQSYESGEAKAKLDCRVSVLNPSEDESTNSLTVGLNAAYTGEFLKLAGKEPVTLAIQDANSAVMFSSGEQWKYIQMPIRP